MPEHRTPPAAPFGGLPPHDLFLEQWILSSVLLNGRDALHEVRGIVRAADFFRESHAHVYAAMLNVDDRGEDPGVVWVAYELNQMGLLDEVGAEPYLVDLACNFIAGVYGHVDAARLVRRYAEQRMQIQQAGRLAREAYSGALPTASALSSEGLLARYTGGLE